MSRGVSPAIAAGRARECAPQPAPATDAARLDELAARLNRCSFTNADPERFHVERNAIVVELRRMAGRMRGEGGRPDYTWRAPPRSC